MPSYKFTNNSLPQKYQLCKIGSSKMLVEQVKDSDYTTDLVVIMEQQLPILYDKNQKCLSKGRRKMKGTPADVAQWIECRLVNERVMGSISSQGTCLGYGPGPQ